MNYSRRQLEALGEPLGESVTRLKPGGRIYGGGGGGGGQTGTQTQVTELPEWARPYAQNILAKGEALTEKPYTPYQGERYAGLSDLQKTAMASVASPEAYGKNISGYMSPYMQNVVDIQKREAARQSAMQGAQQQGQATGAGAFGGYREAIQRAERERNLGQQLNDIQERGLQSAYQAAEGTFGRNLQAQTQLGALQQQDIQRPLDIAYQDFQNQLNYPYKQLGFMSDLLRGTPTGSSSAMSMYQSPGSLLGQLGGIGMGMYGMSRAFAADGGLMESYAGGGVTSEENKQDIIGNLSDAQLKQAYQAALDRRDVDQANLIDQELAERASMRRGLGSIPVDFAAFMPDEESMARGGIVAFAKGELVADDTVYDPVTGVPIYGSQSTGGEDTTLREAIGLGNVENRRALEAATRPAVKPAPAKVEPTAKDREIMAKAEADMAPAAPPKAPAKSISEAARIVTDVAKTQVPKDDVNKLYEDVLSKMNSAPGPEAEALARMLDKAERRAEDIKARGVGDALMKFGFGMAAAASKPGQARRAGLAGALESAAAASPLLAESLAENEKLQAAAEDNALKLRLENARYKSAVEQGNKQLAASLAGSISQRNLQQATLEEQINQNARANALKQQEIAGIAAYRQASTQTAIQKIADDLQASDPKLDRKTALNEASRISGYSFRTEGAMGGKLAAAVSKIEEDYKMLPALMAGNPNSQFVQNMAADRQRRLNEVYRLYGTEQAGGVTSGQSPAPGAGQMKIVGVR